MKTLLKYGRLPDLEAVFRRFPVAMMCAVALTGILMLTGFNIRDEHLGGAAGGLILGFYCCILLQLAAESRPSASRYLGFAKFGVVLLAVLLSAFWQELAFIVPLAIVAAIVFLGNAAFWRRERNDKGVWLFTQKLWVGAIFAAVGSGIFTAGTFAIVAALKILFGLDVDELATHIILPIGLTLLAPAYWLGTLPYARSVEGETFDTISFEARALGFLGTWILAPLTLIYGLIVLAYALRILVTWELPKGEIAGLVTPFIAIGTFTWLVLEPSVMKAGALVRLYKRLWFPFALVATTLLLIAVGVRVGVYGLTTERNLLAAFAVAAAILGAWFTFRPGADIRIPTAAAAGFFLLTAFVAQPAADVSQFSRLKSALAKAENSQVYDTVQYLVRNDRQSWLREEFEDAPNGNYFDNEWREYLSDRGFEPSETTDSDWRSAHLSTPVPYDLSTTPVLVASGPISYAGASARDRVFEGSGVMVSDEDVKLWLDDTVHDLEVSFDIRQVYRDNAMPDDRFNGRPQADIAPIGFALPDGRIGKIIISNLHLNGELDDLSGGYGQALIFTDR